MKILCISAHPDDLEFMAGGSVAKWSGEGHEIHALTLTDGSWTSPNGMLMRTADDAVNEEKKAAEVLGYTVENLGYPMDLSFGDKLVVEVLRRIEKFNIDTVICPWEDDQNHDHEIAARIAIVASKKLPRVFMGQVNYYVRNFFTPNVFIDITSTWDKKIESLKSYNSEWNRTGKDWLEFLDVSTRYYGKIVGVERAEGFICNKLLL